MTDIVKAKFIQPYAQEALGGELGLTSKDMAFALDLPHYELIKDLRGRHYFETLKQAGFEFREISLNSKGRGRKGKAYVFTIDAAKAVVAVSRTSFGIHYLRYLLDCERAIEQGLPKLEAKVKELVTELRETREKLSSLERPKVRKGQKTWRVVVGYRTERLLGLDGIVEEKFPVIREIPIDNMTDDERRIWEAQHLSKISSGMSKKSAALLNCEVKPGTKVISLTDRRKDLRKLGQ
jgi:phage anti-repressor protein